MRLLIPAANLGAPSAASSLRARSTLRRLGASAQQLRRANVAALPGTHGAASDDPSRTGGSIRVTSEEELNVYERLTGSLYAQRALTALAALRRPTWPTTVDATSSMAKRRTRPGNSKNASISPPSRVLRQMTGVSPSPPVVADADSPAVAQAVIEVAPAARSETVPVERSDDIDLPASSTPSHDMPETSYAGMARRQLALEMEQLDATVNEYRSTLSNVIRVGRGASLPVAQRLVVAWFGPLCAAIDEEQARCREHAPGVDRSVYGRHLILLRPEKLAVIVMHHVLNTVLLQGGAAKVTALALEVGRQVEAEVGLTKLRHSGHRREWAALHDALKGREGAALRRHARAALQADAWTQGVHAKLGALLISLLCTHARVEVLRDGALAVAAAPASPGGEGDAPMSPDAVAAAANAPLSATYATRDAAAAESFGLNPSAWFDTDASHQGTPRASPPSPTSSSVLAPLLAGNTALSRAMRDAVAAAGSADTVTATHAVGAESSTSSASAATSRWWWENASAATAASPVPAAAAAWWEPDDLLAAMPMAGANRAARAERIAAASGSDAEHGTGGAAAAAAARAAAHLKTSTAAAAPSLKSQLAESRAPRLETDPLTGVTRVTVPAFAHMYLRSPPPSQKMAGVLLLHPRVDALLNSAAVRFAPPAHLPMLVPPRPWRGPRSGGYLRQRTALIRLTGSVHAQEAAVRSADMPRVYEALNALGSTAWRINAPMLGTIKEAWAAGGGIAELPSASNLPPPPPLDAAALNALPPDEKAAAVRRYRATARHVYNANTALHSLRCDLHLKVAIAERFDGPAPFYFPFNMDFRGRVYPVPPHLNHMGSDMCRGLLLFAQPKALGVDGLRWLKVHLANQMGRDKLPFDERIAYIDDHLADAADSADKPLTGNGWWRAADAPWQALAAAIELTAALRSGDPAAYQCALPVQLDGSCNGLQHYAALGRDEAGGRAVNLLPPAADEVDRPQDVYTQVLRLVLAQLEADAALTDEVVAQGPAGAAAGVSLSRRDAFTVARADGYGRRAAKTTSLSANLPSGSATLREAYVALTAAAEAAAESGGGLAAASTATTATAATGAAAATAAVAGSEGCATPPAGSAAVLDALTVRRAAARFLRGHVDRKVVKQTVMTSVYGVTFFGAREQIAARLKDKFVSGGAAPAGMSPDELDEAILVCASYLARLTLSSLGDLFVAADDIKAWLGNACRLVASQGQPMSWLTPLGLPVIQPYRREDTAIVKTVLQDVVVADSSEALPVSSARQRSAFPPNFVHSLDSTHMMLTALDMRARGLTFTAVHDSYWTHAADVDIMAASLREQFIALYSQPLLEQLRASLVVRFPAITFPELPARGTLNLEDVRHAKYFFS